MGCVSSKHLKQQASIDGWTPPPSRATTPRAKTITTNYSVECYHRHFVSLTSTSYGSLKIESPKPAEARLTHDRAAFTSLNQMYGKLRTLEMVDSAHINPSYDISSGMQSTFQGCVHKSPMELEASGRWSSLGSLGIMDSTHIKPLCNVNGSHNAFSPCMYESPPQLGENHQWSIETAEFALPETINVKEMMSGLEEAAPSHGSSPVKRAPSTSGIPKAKPLKHTRQLKKEANAMGHTGTFKDNSTAPAAEWSDGDDEFGNENASPFHDKQQIRQPLAKMTRSVMGNAPLSQVSPSSYKPASTAWYPSSHSPLSKPAQPTPKSAASMRSPLRNAERARDLQPARRAALERGSLCSGIQNSKSSPGLSSTSSASARSVHYTPAKGKVKLTLQVQHREDAANILTPSPNPSRARRLALGGRLASSVESGSPTFDPDLVASYEKALSTVSQGDWNSNHADIPKGNRYSPAKTGAEKPFIWVSKSMPRRELDKKLYDPFECFKAICPPGGEKAVVLYTTTLRGIRKTFEDCNSAREILQGYGLSIDERDVSMHLEFLNELRELMDKVVSVPRVFIKGHYIGGIEEVVQLHENGNLSELVEGLPKQINGGSCDGCGGVRFVPCLECSGSCKIRSEEDDRVITRCPDCNENGLIQCPICT